LARPVPETLRDGRWSEGRRDRSNARPMPRALEARWCVFASRGRPRIITGRDVTTRCNKERRPGLGEVDLVIAGGSRPDGGRDYRRGRNPLRQPHMPEIDRAKGTVRADKRCRFVTETINRSADAGRDRAPLGSDAGA
jgi:hypothetical protein